MDGLPWWMASLNGWPPLSMDGLLFQWMASLNKLPSPDKCVLCVLGRTASSCFWWMVSPLPRWMASSVCLLCSFIYVHPCNSILSDNKQAILNLIKLSGTAWKLLVMSTGNPGVIFGWPWPQPFKTHDPTYGYRYLAGTGMGMGFMRVGWVVYIFPMYNKNYVKWCLPIVLCPVLCLRGSGGFRKLRKH